MRKIERAVINSFENLSQTQVIEITQVIKSVLYDTLSQASKKVYDGGADRELLIRVYNELLKEFKNG